MAGFSITGQMKVATLQKSFLKEFGLTLRIYQGRSFADPTQTLAQVRKTKGTGKALAVAKNMKVGNLEDKFEAEFGLKVQVAGSDDSYLCDNDLTLNAAQQEDDKKLARKERKAARQTDLSDNAEEPQTTDAESGDEEESQPTNEAKLKGFIGWDKDEDSLKDWALNYVKAYRDEIEPSNGARIYPFLVINRDPDFWSELPNAFAEMADTENPNHIARCTVAGPYCVDTEWLPESWGHECYVYQNYDEGEADSGVEFEEGDSINYVALRLTDFLAHLASGTSPKQSTGVNGLSPRQFAELITYLSENVDESLDVTKNDFESGPFIFSPDLDWLIEQIIDEKGIEKTDQIAEELVHEIDGYSADLCNATWEEPFFFHFCNGAGEKSDSNNGTHGSEVDDSSQREIKTYGITGPGRELILGTLSEEESQHIVANAEKLEGILEGITDRAPILHLSGPDIADLTVTDEDGEEISIPVLIISDEPTFYTTPLNEQIDLDDLEDMPCFERDNININDVNWADVFSDISNLRDLSARVRKQDYLLHENVEKGFWGEISIPSGIETEDILLIGLCVEGMGYYCTEILIGYLVYDEGVFEFERLDGSSHTRGVSRNSYIVSEPGNNIIWER